MAWLWSFLLFAILLNVSQSEGSSTHQLFDEWCQRHGKTYSSDQEKLYRLKVFEDNHAFVTQHNSNSSSSSYALTLNAFADLTHLEFKSSRLGLSSAAASRLKSRRTSPYRSVGNVPPSVDWRQSGAVTPVKDQGSCGACWAFSATGAIEGINKIKSGSLVSLSEQELIDCDRSYNSGCGGGLMDYAYEFIVQNNGIDTEEDYPFQGGEKKCNKEKLKRHVVTIDGYTDIPASDEKGLLQAVATQPVSVGVSGGERAFQLYSKGIFTGPCSTTLDHAVLIVGYGSQDGVDYWIIKNSWGKNWGIDGYMHMQRNSGNSKGVCGINTLASYPVKTSPNPPTPPPPGPTKCNIFTSCDNGETCCCAKRILGFCSSWKCCELDSAVCCKDNRHCCPHDYPICDIEREQCLKKTGNVTMVKGLKKKGTSNGLNILETLAEGMNM